MKNLSKSEMNAVMGGIGPKSSVSGFGYEPRKSFWDKFVEIFVDTYRPY